MTVGNPVDVLQNSFPQRWDNIEVLFIHLPDLEKRVDHVKSATPIILISYI